MLIVTELCDIEGRSETHSSVTFVLRRKKVKLKVKVKVKVTVKVKVNFTLEQATKAYRESRGIALLF